MFGILSFLGHNMLWFLGIMCKSLILRHYPVFEWLFGKIVVLYSKE